MFDARVAADPRLALWFVLLFDGMQLRLLVITGMSDTACPVHTTCPNYGISLGVTWS